MSRRGWSEAGQASLLVVGGLVALVLGALVLALVARGGGREARAQRAADLGALAGARAMHDAYARLFVPVFADRTPPGARHVDKAEYLALGRAAAERVARANGAGAVRVAFPDGASFAPVRVSVTVRDVFEVRTGAARRSAPITARAEAELAPPGALAGSGGGYDGPLAERQGERMRPDVARAFDRMERAARGDGIALLITSAFRSDAEQAVLYARHPDPRWVAPPGRSLHRLGTELDLGPPSAYRWLAANAERFHFTQRYSWEPWHFGYTLNAHSSPATPVTADGDGASSLPGFVPPAFAPALARAAQRWNVSATLLAAQLYAESNFNPFAVSPAGAQGIAQFMPGTAAAMGLRDPFDAERAIDAQAHLMRDLLRRFPAVPLALAAYNAGAGAVAACGCVPANGETPGYVARILGLMGGAGAATGGALEVRLVG
ncbi:MAG TPA: transglycosylase SLT domain-containing protein [Solirubrobacteraceae bacterium]|nr:transglycosylase SLT domain-containing protein [Solirubrobacteraceae bacterium]